MSANPIATYTGGFRIPRSRPLEWLLLGAVVTGVGYLTGTFRVPQTEVAYVTRFGKVVNPSAGPIGPGLHMKLPLIDSVDMLSISTDTLVLPEMVAFTKDTQQITMRLGLTYRIPETAAYHLLYEVGKTGNVDIVHNIQSIAQDRARAVIGKHDVQQVGGGEREQILNEIKAVVSTDLARLFRIEISDVQIPTLAFGATYQKAVDQATTARAEKTKAEIDRQRAEITAQSVRIAAEGEANAARVKAQGEADAALARARANAEATRLKGEADAAAARIRIEAAGGIDAFVRQLQAQAAQNWKGDVPQVSAGAGSGTSIPIVVPIDAKH